MTGEFGHRLRSRGLRQLRIQPRHRRPQVAFQDRLAGVFPAEGSVRAESLGIECEDAVPSQHLFQMHREGRLDQLVLAVDVGFGHLLLPGDEVQSADFQEI